MSGAKASKPSKRDRARHGGHAVRPPRLPTPPTGQATGGAIAADGGGRRSLADWPVVEAFVNIGWDAEGGLATVYIARHHPRYEVIETGLFLVDLQCLGVKSTMRRRARDEMTYERQLRPILMSSMPHDLVPITPELAAKIVASGLAYAESLGFDPDPDFKHARIVLDGLDPDADPTPVPLGGSDGKPYFIAGPHDDAVAIMKQLQRRLGSDGFHFLAPIEGFDDALPNGWQDRFEDDDFDGDGDDVSVVYLDDGERDDGARGDDEDDDGDGVADGDGAGAAEREAGGGRSLWRRLLGG